jgi:hypothetical protein
MHGTFSRSPLREGCKIGLLALTASGVFIPLFLAIRAGSPPPYYP